MNKILLLVVLALLAVATADISTSGKITGNFLANDVSVSIQPTEKGRLAFFDYTRVLSTYETQSITVEFMNTGNLPYEQHIEIAIMDVNLTILANYVGDYTTLSAREREQFSINYTTDEPGYYWIRAMSKYSTKKIYAWGLYIVNGTKILPYYAPPTLPAATEGAGSSGAPSGDPVDLHSYLKPEYHPNITLTQNQSTLTYVVVKNTGFASANNVVLLPTSFGIKTDVTPKIIAEIPPGEEGVFIISIDIAEDAEPDTYALDFSVLSDDSTVKGHIDVIVRILHPLDEFNSTIMNYEFLLDRLRNDAIKANLGGINMSSAFANLDGGDKYLDLARSSLSKNDYFETKRNLKVVKEHIEGAALDIARARMTLPYHAIFPIVSVFLLVLAFVLLALMLFLHHRNEAKKRKEGEGVRGEIALQKV